MLAVFWNWPEIADSGERAGTRRGMLEAVTCDLRPGPQSATSAGVAISLVLAVAVVARSGWSRRADLLAVVACSAAYVVCSAPPRPCCSTPLALPLTLAGIAFPFAFWRLTRVVLQDDPSVPRAAWVALAALLASGLVATADLSRLARSVAHRGRRRGQAGRPGLHGSGPAGTVAQLAGRPGGRAAALALAADRISGDLRAGRDVRRDLPGGRATAAVGRPP